ncbi:NucA/NucB deoxyribonuclease domain-containing protein [Nonomuraea sp. NPDC049714]|uniref:NucA/NucB deoxyribonuclease domain-containing protein n=1 Tax=Nonomuraea sp. NPDC049714 TaxID=3364357 RepID=UPI00378AF05C
MDVGTTEEMSWPIPANNDWHKFLIKYCKYCQSDKYPDAWRSDKLPIGGSNSCDEYPFASSKEGAGTAQGNYSLRALNKSHNSTHGRKIGLRYTEYRVGTGNSFWVLIDPEA